MYRLRRNLEAAAYVRYLAVQAQIEDGEIEDEPADHVPAVGPVRRRRGQHGSPVVWAQNYTMYRPVEGRYVTLLAHLQDSTQPLHDKTFFKLMRMDKHLFHQIVEELTPLIQKKDTNWRSSISAGEIHTNDFSPQPPPCTRWAPTEGWEEKKKKPYSMNCLSFSCLSAAT